MDMAELEIDTEDIQTTQPTSGVAVTPVTNCCANCVEPSPNLPFFWQAGHEDQLGGWRWSSQKRVMLRLIQVRQHQTNERVWICDICYKQIHVRKQISIRYNRFEHWVYLRCACIRQAQYTDTWTHSHHHQTEKNLRQKKRDSWDQYTKSNNPVDYARFAQL